MCVVETYAILCGYTFFLVQFLDAKDNLDIPVFRYAVELEVSGCGLVLPLLGLYWLLGNWSSGFVGGSFGDGWTRSLVARTFSTENVCKRFVV